MKYRLWEFYKDFVQVIYCIPPLLLGNFDRLSADGDGVTDGLLGGLTDESDDVQTERNAPRFWMFGKFVQQYLQVFTVNLAGGWIELKMDILMDGWSSRWNCIWVDRM